MNRNEKRLGGAVSLIAAIVGIWVAVPWAQIIPVTRAQHDADIEEVRSESSDAINAFYRNWRCDEWLEELDDLLDKEASGDITPQELERMSRLRDHIDEDDCGEFE